MDGWPARPTLVDHGLELLDEDECLRLAARRPIGRVAVNVAALPAVFPVNFVIGGRDVFFRTGSGTKLHAATSNAVVAFEVDDFDVMAHAGWSVQVVGMATEIADDEVGDLGFAIPVRAWARGSRTHLVRISGDVITGRRIAILGGDGHGERDGLAVSLGDERLA